MSDSDDTDALLLVPPDFFYVHSDSEDNFFCDVTREQNSEFERMVFHGLIDHVSELEDRVHVIEQSDRLNSCCSDKVSDNQYWDSSVNAFHDFDSLHFSQYNHRHSRTFENIRNYPVIQDSAVNTTAIPVKHKIPLSLPSTPKSDSRKSQQQTLKSSVWPDSLVNQPCTDVVKRIPGVTTTAMQSVTSSEDTASLKIMADDSAVKETTELDSTQDCGTPAKNNTGQDLMSEIDEFLNSTKKNKLKGLSNFGITDNAVRQQHRNFASTSLPVFGHSQTVLGAKQYELDTGMRRLALSDIARLLDEVKTTETEITHKLNVAKKPVPDKDLLLQTSVYRTASVPKLHLSESSTSAEASDLLKSTIKGKVDESNLGHVETGHHQRECSVAFTKNPSNTNQESFVRSGPKSARRRLDLGYELPACPSLQSKMLEVDNRESPANSSDTAYATLPNSGASTSQADTVVLAGQQGDSRGLDKCSLGFTTYSSSVQGDQPVEVNADSTSAFSSRTYPHLVTDRIGASLDDSLRFLQPGARVGLKSAVPRGASREVTHEGHRQRTVPSSADNSAADHTGQVPLKLGFENDPVKTRAVQGSECLLSLSELWSGEELSGDYEANPARRLEEERYRRQHCERMIRQLQARLLEDQQKLSVAVEVDRAKDRAILQLQAGWRQLLAHWHELEEQRHSVTNTLHVERESFQRDLARASQRVQHLERELSQMLDLARDYKEKNEAISREITECKIEHERELQKAVARTQELEHSLLSASAALKDAQVKEEELVGQLLSAQKEVHKENEATQAACKELEQLQEMSARLEAELAAAKEEKASLQLKLKEEKNRNSLLDKQKKGLLVSLEDMKKKEKAQREEERAAAERLERTKLELRDHYQQQVEKMVQDKMREFQAQLDADEASMRSELQQRERAITELAAQQIKQIADKHKLEIALLEEKHQEEQQLMRVQMSQSEKRLADLQAKFAQVQDHRGQVAERLHAIMERQWRESVRIIAGGSPLPPTKPEAGSLTSHSGSSSTTDSLPFAQDSQLTFRQNTGQSQQSGRADELKTYIAMLLDCKPGNPVTDLIPTSECGHTAAEQEYLNARMEPQVNQYPQLGQVTHHDLQATSAVTNKDNQAGKPPWK